MGLAPVDALFLFCRNLKSPVAQIYCGMFPALLSSNLRQNLTQITTSQRLKLVKSLFDFKEF